MTICVYTSQSHPDAVLVSPGLLLLHDVDAALEVVLLQRPERGTAQ